MYHGDHFVMFKNIKSLCCTPETDIILLSHLYYTLIKKRERDFPGDIRQCLAGSPWVKLDRYLEEQVVLHSEYSVPR